MFGQEFVFAEDRWNGKIEFERTINTLLSDVAIIAWERTAKRAAELEKEGKEIVHFERVFDFSTNTLHGYFIYFRERSYVAKFWYLLLKRLR